MGTSRFDEGARAGIAVGSSFAHAAIATAAGLTLLRTENRSSRPLESFFGCLDAAIAAPLGVRPERLVVACDLAAPDRRDPSGALVAELDSGIRDRGVCPDLYVMQANGGVAAARSLPEAWLPTADADAVAGIVGAIRSAEMAGFGDLLVVDWGAETVHVAVVRDGAPVLRGRAGAAVPDTVHRPVVELSPVPLAGHGDLPARLVDVARAAADAHGLDPRRHALVAIGGAGGRHACALAERLGFRRILVPRHPGASGAMGLLAASLRQDAWIAWSCPLPGLDPAELDRRIGRLEVVTRPVIAPGGDAGERVRVELEMRTQGREDSVVVPFPGRPVDADSLVSLESDFAVAYLKRHGHLPASGAVEVAGLRVSCSARGQQPDWPPLNDRSRPDSTTVPPRPSGLGARVPVYSRERLPDRAVGPLTVLQEDATVTLAGGWRSSRRAGDSLLLEPVSTTGNGSAPG